uniref:AMDV5_3 n=1 Tax=uncultured virus TaxID=340016 RepID=B3GAN5_9VIRU|nr:AMDV5_3 [uncultured virus]
MEIKYNYDRILVIGRSGSGKTRFISELLKDVPNYLVLTQKVNDYYLKRHIILLNNNIEESINDFIHKGIKNAPITLIFEDLPSYIYTSRLPHQFQNILLTGRHIGIGCIFISQRYRTIPVLLRTQSNIHIYFQSAIDDYSILPKSVRDKLYALKQYESLIYNYDNGEIYMKSA